MCWSDWVRLKTPAQKQQHLWRTLLDAAQAGLAGADALRLGGSSGGGRSSSGASGGVQRLAVQEGVKRVAARWWRRLLNGGG